MTVGRLAAGTRFGAFVVAVVLALSGAGASAAAQDYRLLRLDGQLVKWGAPRLGSGATITWAVVRQPLALPGAINCAALAPVTGLRVEGIGGGGGEAAHAAVRQSARAAFAMWEAVADVRFREAATAASADIVIGAQGAPKGIAFANVEPRKGAAGPVAGLRRAAVCLSPRQRWQVAAGGPEGTYWLRHVLAHEIGHAIGLNHPGPTGQLMGYRYEASPDRLQPGDVAGAVLLYGPRRQTRAAVR